MVGRAEVDAKRNELLSLKESVRAIFAEYKTQAELRIARQTDMAKIVQIVQNRSSDIPLVEDVILASLWAENRALKSKQPVPEAPEIDPYNQPQGMTKSAEEAIAVYNSQIQILTSDKMYRQALLDNEIAMAKELEEGILQIENIVQDYCDNPSLTNLVLQITQNSGSSSTDY
jgi:hypothetical protein